MEQFLIPILAGLFALLGGWIGARLTRATEQERWLREARAEAFAKLWSVLNECEDKIYDGKRDLADGESPELWIGQQMWPAYNQGRIVRLFLAPTRRKQLFDALMKIEGGHYPSAKSSLERHRGVELIQDLLEQ